MNLTEGAKITNQLVSAALQNPDFTFGFEAEFFYQGIDEFMVKYMTRNSELDEAEGWHVQLLGDTRWHDVLMFFYPMAVSSESQQDNHTIMRERLSSKFTEATEYDPDDHDQTWPTESEMFATLHSEMKMPAIMALLQVYPMHGMQLSESQEKSVKAVIQRGDVQKASTLGKLENYRYRTYEEGWEAQMFYVRNQNESAREIFYEIFAFQLQKYLGEQVVFSANAEEEGNYLSRDYTTWTVLPDGSLTTVERYTKDVIGIEIISPVMPLAEGLEYMQKILKVIEDPSVLGFGTLSGVTTMDTGFHINLGIGGKQIDYLKLIMLMGDHATLQQYGRGFYDQAEPMLPNIINSIDTDPAKAIPLINQLVKKTGITQADMTNVITNLKKQVPVDKFQSVNLTKLENGYIEFRAAGGKDYHTAFNKIRMTVLQLAVWMYVATQPDIYKNEYYKALVKFIQTFQTGDSDYLSRDFSQRIEKLRAEPEVEQPINDSIGATPHVGPTGRRGLNSTGYMDSMWVPEPENSDGYHSGDSEDDLP